MINNLLTGKCKKAFLKFCAEEYKDTRYAIILEDFKEADVTAIWGYLLEFFLRHKMSIDVYNNGISEFGWEVTAQNDYGMYVACEGWSHKKYATNLENGQIDALNFANKIYNERN